MKFNERLEGRLYFYCCIGIKLINRSNWDMCESDLMLEKVTGEIKTIQLYYSKWTHSLFQLGTYSKPYLFLDA